MLCNHMSKALFKIFYHHCFSLEHSLTVMGFSCKQWLDGAWIMQNKLLISAIRVEVLKGQLRSHSTVEVGSGHRVPDNVTQTVSAWKVHFVRELVLTELPGSKPSLGLLGSGCSQKCTSHSLTATHSLSLLRMGCGIWSVA